MLSVSLKVMGDNLKFMPLQLAGLDSLILLETNTPTSFVQRDYDFQVAWADHCHASLQCIQPLLVHCRQPTQTNS